MLFTLLLALTLEGAAPSAAPPQALAPGVTLLPGGFEPNRGPDGATIVFDAPDGLVVVDSGRHAWHSSAILALAEARGRPIAAIVNTHWHLDHSSGNGRLKAAFPRARLYATTAVNRVLAPGGFLERQVGAARDMLGTELPAVEREEVQIFLDTMAAQDGLRPDVAVTHDGPLVLAGRRFEAHVTDGAVTDADLWLFDRESGVAVIGDLVTLPAPFFETACPERWRAALDQVWATPFRIVVPGHGPAMTRAQFATWRAAYGAFVDCVSGETEASACAAAWTRDVAPFLEGDALAQRRAPQMAAYYVDFLRANGGKSPDCLAR